MARVTLSDDLYDLLKDGRRTPAQVDTLVAQLIQAFPTPFHPEARSLVLDSDTLLGLDVVLGQGNVQSGPELLQKVRNLADIEVGKVKIPLSAPQLAALKERGLRAGKSSRAVLEQIVLDFLERYEGIPV